MSAAINFPMSLDDATSMPDPTQYDQIDQNANNTRHDEVETRQNNAIKAIEAAVGISATTTVPTGGTGSPEGVVSGGLGRTYVDNSVAPPSFWVKSTASGNTGWRQLIA